MKYLLTDLLKLYKRFVSPLLPLSCRFTPTCSEYAMEAVGRHGAVLGLWMAFKRLMRCQPFCEGGHDPVRE
ncbi:MAG TPA: membrane protein insertion efficiency factor YidD [Aridibacter sp.]|nr:membrane protein insertion efficiency factor YidD [Aridibacter sp.]